MPLSEKARIEVYLPDAPHPAYAELLEVLDREFTYPFGGCTLVRGLEGSYLSRLGAVMRDRVNVLYFDNSAWPSLRSPVEGTRTRGLPPEFRADRYAQAHRLT